jgi:hypothetical protein
VEDLEIGRGGLDRYCDEADFPSRDDEEGYIEFSDTRQRQFNVEIDRFLMIVSDLPAIPI